LMTTPGKVRPILLHLFAAGSVTLLFFSSPSGTTGIPVFATAEYLLLCQRFVLCGFSRLPGALVFLDTIPADRLLTRSPFFFFFSLVGLGTLPFPPRDHNARVWPSKWSFVFLPFCQGSTFAPSPFPFLPFQHRFDSVCIAGGTMFRHQTKVYPPPPAHTTQFTLFPNPRERSPRSGRKEEEGKVG